jgi:hypothetical protein
MEARMSLQTSRISKFFILYIQFSNQNDYTQLTYGDNTNNESQLAEDFGSKLIDGNRQNHAFTLAQPQM